MKPYQADGDPSVISQTGTVKWSKKDSNTYKVGPYKVKYTGEFSSIVIYTDNGTYKKEGGSYYKKNASGNWVSDSSGNITVGSIGSESNFYINVKKGCGIREIERAKVYIKRDTVYTSNITVYLDCIWVGSYHENASSQPTSATAEGTQDLACYTTDTRTETKSDSVGLPGAKGVLDLVVEKKDLNHTSNKVKGAEFKLYKGNTLIDTKTTNSSGKATFADLFFDEYILKETKAASGYEITGYATFDGTTYTDLTNIPIDLTEQTDSSVTVHAYDNCLTDLVIEKYDRYHPENKLKGVTFELWQGNTKVASGKTNNDGKLRFSDLKYGDYILKETATISGYEIAGYAIFNGNTYTDLTSIPIKLTPQLATKDHEVGIAVYNNCLVDLVVKKYDRWEPEKVVAGIEFELWKGNLLIARKVTDNNGEIRFSNLQYGTYELKETKTIEGYEIAGYAIFNGVTYTDLTSMSLDLTPDLATKDHNDLVIMAYDNSFIKLGGKVFLDEKNALVGKILKENGYQDSSEQGVPGIPVTVYREDGVKIIPPDGLPNPINTDGNGRYDFGYNYKLSKQYGYYIKFEYDGQNYEPTTYRASGPKEDISYSTDGKSNRMSFNKEYEYITGERARSRNICAYSGSDGINKLTIYDKKSDPVEIMNINLGLLKREEFDLNLKKDINVITLSVNGKTHTYNVDRRNLPDQDVQLDLRGTDFNLYEREIRRADIAHEGSNELNVKVEYKIRIMNESLDEISGQVTNLLEYFSSSYDYVPGSSYSINNAGTKTAVNWTNLQIGNNGYYSMQTTDLSNLYLRKGDMVDIYLTFEVKKEALKNLINTDTDFTITENFAEIGGFRTTYSNQRKDLNNNVISNAGEVAGLLDKDSVPNNFKPEELNDYLRSEEYKNNTSSSQKKQEIRKRFEDDADKAPGLKLKLNHEERSLTGTVFEDNTTVNENKERLGDGILSSEDTNRVKGATVELLQQVGDSIEKVYLYNSATKKNDILATTTTDDQGNYSFSGYLPADGYFVRYKYGDTEQTAKTYNGQDYKSTIKNYDNPYITNEFAQKHQGAPYWYSEKADKRISDATDDLDRRKEVNQWAMTLNNYKARVLNKENTIDLSELINNTWMQASTDTFTAEVEYARNTTNPSDSIEYKIYNIDFGVAKRPEAELTLEKKVNRIQIFTNDEQTLFDSTEKAPNLAWVPGRYVQATVDENLLHGATLKIYYTMKITNTGETDYVVVNGDQVNVDELYYTTGHKSSNSQESQTKAEVVIDYIENNLAYKQEDIQNQQWETVRREELQKGTATNPSKDSLIDDTLTNSIKTYETLIKTKTDNVLLQSLKPGESTQDSTVIVSKVLTSENTEDFIFDNNVEIILSSNQQGRRSYTEENRTSIPGNLDPVAKINREEPDSFYAETVTVLIPFGKNKSVTIITVTIIAILILGSGIILIKKKVL